MTPPPTVLKFSTTGRCLQQQRERKLRGVLRGRCGSASAPRAPRRHRARCPSRESCSRMLARNGSRCRRSCHDRLASPLSSSMRMSLSSRCMSARPRVSSAPAEAGARPSAGIAGWRAAAGRPPKRCAAPFARRPAAALAQPAGGGGGRPAVARGRPAAAQGQRAAAQGRRAARAADGARRRGDGARWRRDARAARGQRATPRGHAAAPRPTRAAGSAAGAETAACT